MNKLLQNGFLTKTVVGAAASLPLVAATSCTAAQEQSKPNIVVVLCDDLGYGDIGCNGHEYIKTPTLDRLAEEGIRLTNFYSTAAVSSPSRAGLLTGRNPNKAGFYDFIPGPKKSEDCRDLVHLQAHEITIPALLKSAGYSTCLSGKWHCSSYFNNPKKNPNPDHFGFDHWFATHNNAAPSHRNPNNFVRNGEKVGELIGYSSEVVVNEAIGWLESRKDETNPFYLHVTFHEPHENIASPEDLVEKHLGHAKNREEAEFFANVENMDRNLGRLVDYLREKHGENTLIVFSSDNGPETLMRYSRAKHSYGTTGGLKGMKLWTNEGGIHVPGIMTWLGKETFTGVSESVVSALDYLPSFCELAGVELPERKIDGESMLTIFEDGKFERKTSLIWLFFDAINDQVAALRDGDWKIMCSLYVDGELLPNLHNLYSGNYETIKNAELRDFTLYNLKEDRFETTDLSKSNPEMFEKMKAKMKVEFDALMAESHVWVRQE